LGFTEKKSHHDKWLLDYLVDVRFILGNKGAGFQFFLFKFMDLACVLPGLQTCKKNSTQEQNKLFCKFLEIFEKQNSRPFGLVEKPFNLPGVPFWLIIRQNRGRCWKTGVACKTKTSEGN